MPLYYDTSEPRGNSKNTITRTATDFGLRDFLLLKNIQNPIKYPYLSTSINGGPRGGEPVLDTMIGYGSINRQRELTDLGVGYYNSNIIINHYKNNDLLAPEFLDINMLNAIPIFTTSPNGIGNYQQEDISKYGLLAKTNEKEYRKNSTVKNLYLDASKQLDAADSVNLQPQQSVQQLPSYIDEYGNLNIGSGSATNAADIIGSIATGQGLGLDVNGIVNNFDVRASLVGRVLAATGVINDTKLGMIGGQQLALALANNAAFNTQQRILGGLNINDNILSLVKNGNLAGFRPNYTITVPTGGVGRTLDTAARILGFTVPRSYLDDDGSIFSTENGNIANIERANAMILNTGKGQVEALLTNMLASLNGTSQYDIPTGFRSGYSPKFNDNRGDEMISNANLYAFYGPTDTGNVIDILNASNNGVIPNITHNRENMIKSYGFVAPNDSYGGGSSHIIQPTFTWGASTVDSASNIKPVNAVPEGTTLTELPSLDKKSLLSKTQRLFNSGAFKTMVSVRGDMSVEKGSQIQSAIAYGGGISKGSGVLSSLNFNPNGTFRGGTGRTADNTFCRTWTTFRRYDSVPNLIRHRGLNKSEINNTDIIKRGDKSGGWRQNTDGSVLEDGGFVKIAPYRGDDNTRNASAPKKYMFSIENLAWAGTPAVNLLPCEQGPGDLLTGKFGRIMWFPPYGLEFSESSSVNIESTNFIGRGEPVYTYNNTERTGNLSFKIIIDHPTIMNAFAGDNNVTDEFIDSWFAGCTDLDLLWQDKLTGIEKEEISKNNTVSVPKIVVNNVVGPDNFKIFFPNDVTKFETIFSLDYELSPKGTQYRRNYVGEPQFKNKGDETANRAQPARNFVDINSYGLNVQTLKINGKSYSGWTDPEYVTDLTNYLNNEAKAYDVNIIGYASAQKTFDYANDQLAIDRAENTKKWFLDNIKIDDPKRVKVLLSRSVPKTSTSYNNDTNNAKEIVKRDRYSEIIFVYKPQKTETPKIETIKENNTTTTVTQEIKKRFYTECDFFDRLKDNDPFVFDKISEKIKYFHPSFHSTTPEGFNSRLTFLLQCTRQGPTIPGIEAKNLAFGPPPVCILRIGDFYNTKIMIENVSFDFEPLVWDLNPEGIGVQPMIANVSMTFKYIGGSTLYGPINKLQNALSFNYFANTHVFDPRADYIAKVDGATRPTFGSVNNETPNGQPEPSYSLVTGLDLTNTPMSTLQKNEVKTSNLAESTNANNDVNQVAGANASTNTQNAQTSVDKITKLKITSALVPITALETSMVIFTINRTDNSTTPNLQKDYLIKGTIQNISNPSESYQIRLADPYLKDDLYRTFNIVIDETTRPNGLSVVLDRTKNYILKVEVVGLGVLMHNVVFE